MPVSSQWFAAAETPVAYSFTDSELQQGDETTFTFSSMDLGAADGSRIIVVTVSAGFSNVHGTISSATIGGVSATIICQGDNQDGGTSSIDTATSGIVAAAVPTGTSGNVVITLSRSINAADRGVGIGVYRLTGPGVVAADETGTTAVSNNCGSGVAISLNENTKDGGAVIACSCGNSNLGEEVWTGVTENFRSSGDIPVGSSAGIATTSDESPRTITCTTSSYCRQSGAVAVWNPA